MYSIGVKQSIQINFSGTVAQRKYSGRGPS